MVPTKYIKWFFYFILLSIIGSTAIRFFFSFDETGKEAEIYLALNMDVAKRIGKPESFVIHKVTSVGASSKLTSYKKYSFLVRGQKATADIIVRVDQSTVNNTQRIYSIDSIEVLN